MTPKSFRRVTGILLVIFLMAGAMIQNERSEVRASSATFVVDDDAHLLAAFPSANYGSAPELALKADLKEAHLRFDLSQGAIYGTVSSAQLHVYMTYVNPTGVRGHTYVHRQTLDAQWDETELTWQTRPLAGGVEAVTENATAGQWYSFDVTSFFQGPYVDRPYAFVLRTDEETDVRFASKEHPDGYAPYLTIDYADVTPPQWGGRQLETWVAGADSLQLRWPAVTQDNVGVTQYRVYQDDVLIGNPTGRMWTAEGLVPDQAYTFRVEAGDAAGNWTTNGPVKTVVFSTETPVWTGATLDIPDKQGIRLTLDWSAAAHPHGIDRYEVYQNGVQIATVAGTQTSYNVRALAPGRTYTFRVEAADSSGNLTTGGPVVVSETPLFPPGITAADPYAALGYLDVTLYGADPNGLNDSTAAIQAAMVDGYYYGMAVFFPEGTYTVSDTLEARISLDAWDNEYRPGHVLIGSTDGTRPVIRLADDAPGFNDPDNRKPVLHFFQEQSPGSHLARHNQNYNQMLYNIDVDLSGTGHAGATGVRFRAAEGSAVQNVKVVATGAFAGFEDLPGSGGSMTNIEVVGGRYGIHALNAQPAPLITGLKLSGQTDHAIFYRRWTPLTIVGFDIQKPWGSSVFATLEKDETPLGAEESTANLALIDGRMYYGFLDEQNPMIDNTDRSIYMNNVYIRRARYLIHNADDASGVTIQDPTAWTHVVEYGYSHEANGPGKLWNGETGNTTLAMIVEGILPGAVPQDFIERHVWGNNLPHFEDAGVINVKDAPYGAVGDGVADDTAAIQAAILAGDKVFLPRGRYRISGTLELKENTQLFGVWKTLTVLDPTDWQATSVTPIILTVDDPEATTSLSNLKIALHGSGRQIQAVHWRAGAGSLVKDVWVTTEMDEHFLGGNLPMSRTLISGNGGGKWYNMLNFIPTDTRHPQYRGILVEGTHQPLTFYLKHLNYLAPENGMMMEIRNAANVHMYGLKSESLLLSHMNRPDFRPWPIMLGIQGSSNIRLIGAGGLMQVEPGRGIIEIVDSTDVLLANVIRWGDAHYEELDTWYHVKETIDGITRGLPVASHLNVYKRDY